MFDHWLWSPSTTSLFITKSIDYKSIAYEVWRLWQDAKCIYHQVQSLQHLLDAPPGDSTGYPTPWNISGAWLALEYLVEIHQISSQACICKGFGWCFCDVLWPWTPFPAKKWSCGTGSSRHGTLFWCVHLKWPLSFNMGRATLKASEGTASTAKSYRLWSLTDDKGVIDNKVYKVYWLDYNVYWLDYKVYWLDYNVYWLDYNVYID